MVIKGKPIFRLPLLIIGHKEGKSLIDVFLNHSATFTTNAVPGSPAGLAASVVSQLNVRKSEVEQLLSGKVKLG